MKHWTEKEIGVIKTLYASGGCEAVIDQVPRSKNSIQKMAARLGIKAEKSVFINAAKKYHAEHSRSGENNPRWKGGISKNNMHYKRLQIERYPEKVHARKLLFDAVRQGKIKRRPCEVCGHIKVEGHHDDYSKPYEVHWLCKKHHNEVHKKLNTGRLTATTAM
jgi:hypothetical protein